MRTPWDDRFFATTRGQVLTLLRLGNQTVDDLATALGVSDNAVRSHLYALERDGFVVHEPIRRGAGKPAWLYSLAPAAERIFPKPYASVLDTLLQVLAERLPADAVDSALVDVGQRLARTVPPLTGSTEARMPAVMEALASMGGMAELEDDGRTLTIRGYDCPLASTVRTFPDACRVLQSLLETILEHPVRERCDRQDAPRCCFVVARETAHDGAEA